MRYFDTKNKKSYQGLFCQSLDCVFNSNITLEFRRLVRNKHKDLNITTEDFYLFGQIFIKTLKDFGILSCHLEIIHDNYNSFLAPITNKNNLKE